MKILFIGEYSNVHATLAKGLRTLGHEVCVISNGDFWKNYPRDVDVTRTPGRLGGILLMARIYSLLPKMRGYDIVQLINPMFFELKAERLFWFYKWLRRNNKRLILGAYGMDYYWVHECVTNKPLRYSDFNIGDELRTDPDAMKERHDWLGTAKERLNKMIANDCDGIVTGLYEYDVCYRPHFPAKTMFIPYPIIPANPTIPTSPTLPIKIFVGISRARSAYKGTDVMLRAAQDLAARYPDRVVLTVAEGIAFSKYQDMLDSSDVLLDQLYSYTPAMNALLAMSKGIVVVGGGEPENYDILRHECRSVARNLRHESRSVACNLGETELRPIINVQPNYDSVYSELEQLVLHPERLPQLKQQSVDYILRYHDYIKVARTYETFYTKKLC